MAVRLGLAWACSIALALVLGGSALAEQDAKLVARCADLLTEASQGDPVIPSIALQQAQSILIAPGVVDLQLGLGLRSGRGVAMTRHRDGTWGEPQTVRFSGGSVGYAGRTVTDTIMLFNVPVSATEALERYRLDALKVGIGIGAPVGKWHADAAEAGRDPGDLVTIYHRSRGVFAGGGIQVQKITAVDRSHRQSWLPQTVNRQADQSIATTVAAVLPPSAALERLKSTLARVAASPAAEVAVTPLPLPR